jgi:asparagine synthase (glutamine-hydrolysing)
MTSALAHRGPDDTGVWSAPTGIVTLGHRRLSIIDLSPSGHNPMFWGDERLAITYNGEIYNFRELRRELEQLGHRFRSQTDTEIVLAAYDQWGVECVHRFAGMFAFGLWDAPRRRLWLVRDRVGKKPLYYSERDGALWFASELKALLTDASFPKTIDSDALRLYLKYGYVPSPYTIFNAARKLPPAHFLVCENGRVSLTRYWDPLAHVATARELSDAQAETELESLLSTAVRQRRIADVPLGAFLSGGIDSSLIVAMMSEQSDQPVQTYTIRFSNPEYDEADHAARVARHCRTDHHEQLCDETQMLAAVDRVAELFDEPFADSSAIPTYLLSRVTRQGVTVALSGDGGDELFFGYPRYRYYADAGWALNLPRPARRIGAAIARHAPTRRLQRIADVLGHDGDDAYCRFITWFSPELITQMSGQPALDAPLYRDVFDRAGAVPRAERPGVLDLVSYLSDDILTKVDRASMATSLEVRAPLLDHRVVEFALGLPLRVKRRGNVTKWLLRQLLYKRVPPELVDRPKMGFGVPLRDWLRGPLHDTMREYMASDDLQKLGLDPTPVRTLWDQFTRGRYARADLLWQIFILSAWSRRYVHSRVAAAGTGITENDRTASMTRS